MPPPPHPPPPPPPPPPPLLLLQLLLLALLLRLPSAAGQLPTPNCAEVPMPWLKPTVIGVEKGDTAFLNTNWLVALRSQWREEQVEM